MVASIELLCKNHIGYLEVKSSYLVVTYLVVTVKWLPSFLSPIKQKSQLFKECQEMNVLQPKMKRNKQSLGFMANWTNKSRESCPELMDTHCNYTFTNWPKADSQGNGVYLGFYSPRKRTHLTTMQQDTWETRDGAW